MTQCYTQRNMQSNFYGGQAHEYISENYESVQPENKSLWIGWFVTVHLILTLSITLMMIVIGLNPTLMMSVISAPIWIATVLASKYIADKIMED